MTATANTFLTPTTYAVVVGAVQQMLAVQLLPVPLSLLLLVVMMSSLSSPPPLLSSLYHRFPEHLNVCNYSGSNYHASKLPQQSRLLRLLPAGCLMVKP
jgi:hypothetical protein